MDSPTQELCHALKSRLQNAENALEAALSASPEDHPVVAPARNLLAIHEDIRDLLLRQLEPTATSDTTEDEPEVASAAIEIAREEHTMKADFKDVVKALFMWRDDPVLRARGEDQYPRG